VRQQVECPLFEGLTPDDQNYHLLLTSVSVIVVYPSNVIVIYERRREGEGETTLTLT
jgi:hypothetical protein